MDPQKFPIEITTVADTSGAEEAQAAIKQTAAVADEAAEAQKKREDEARAAFEAEMERDKKRYEAEREKQERERGGAGPQDSAERTAKATEAFNARERVQAIETLVRGLGEASRKIREFEDDLRATNPELADMAMKAADAADGLSKIGQGALQGFAAAGPLGGAIGAVGSALMYMVEGLTASSRAEREFEETLRRTNAETRAAQQAAKDRADALEKSREAAAAAAQAEDALNDKLEAGGEALDNANDALRQRLELLARQSKDQAEIIRLEEDLERKRIAASSMSGEDKAKATGASRDREAARLAALEDARRTSELAAYERAAKEARDTADAASGLSSRMGSDEKDMLGRKEREEIERVMKDLSQNMTPENEARRNALRAQLERDKEVRGFYPGVDDREELNSTRDKLDATGRRAREQEAEARREMDRLAAEQAQAERVRGFAGQGAALDRERDARAGRRRDLEERGRDVEERGRTQAAGIAAEAGAAAERVKSDAGREILQAVKSAFADGVLTDSEKNELASALKAINASKETEIVGTLRDMLSAFESTRTELKSLREQVKALRDR